MNDQELKTDVKDDQTVQIGSNWPCESKARSDAGQGGGSWLARHLADQRGP